MGCCIHIQQHLRFLLLLWCLHAPKFNAARAHLAPFGFGRLRSRLRLIIIHLSSRWSRRTSCCSIVLLLLFLFVSPILRLTVHSVLGPYVYMFLYKHVSVVCCRFGENGDDLDNQPCDAPGSANYQRGHVMRISR